MFADFARANLPALVEAHGKRWIAVYLISISRDHKTSWYLAVDADATFPAPTIMIAVGPDDVGMIEASTTLPETP